MLCYKDLASMLERLSKFVEIFMMDLESMDLDLDLDLDQFILLKLVQPAVLKLQLQRPFDEFSF